MLNLKKNYNFFILINMKYKNLTLIIYLIIGFSFQGCSSKAVKVLSLQPKTYKTKSLDFKSLDIPIGSVKLIQITKHAGLDHKIECKNKFMPHFLVDKTLNFYLPISYFGEPEKQFNCVYKYKKDKDQFIESILAVTIKNKFFPSEKFNVSKKKINLSPKDLKRVLKEKDKIKNLYKKLSQKKLFYTPFRRPLNSKITSQYGKKRIFNNSKKSQHLGIDFRAATGTPIPTANSGRVIFAGYLFFTGNCIIIDHGLNIVTIYGHLSKLNAAEGELVPQGAIIGYSGATGRVSGPHLHWGVKIQNMDIDGFSLIKTGI